MSDDRHVLAAALQGRVDMIVRTRERNAGDQLAAIVGAMSPEQLAVVVPNLSPEALARLVGAKSTP